MSAGEEDAGEIMAAMVTLADQALVRQAEGPGAPRFTMLKTIREFGLGRLADTGEGDLVRRAHAGWRLLLVERSGRAYQDRQEFAVLSGLEPERDNLQAALTWLATVGDAAGLLRLAGSTAPFWFARGHRREGRDWVERALSLADGRPVPAEAHGRALAWAAIMARNEGDYAQAMVRGNEALFISPKTASKHVSNILGKPGVANRREAAAIAVRHALH